VRARSVRVYPVNLTLIVAIFAGAVSLIAGCAGGSIDTGDQARFTALSAAGSTVRVNQQIQFTNNGLKLGSPMTFYVDGIQGGNAELGTVDNAGLYTAPAIVPTPNSVTVTAHSIDHPTFPQGTASVSVLNPIPIITTVTPSTFPEGSAQVAVNGSQFVFGAQILWNGTAVPTTLVSNTQLVAVIPAPNPGTFPLLVSNPNPGAANSSTVPVVVGPGQVVLTLQAGDGSDVRVSNPLSFGLTVNGTNNTAVTLKVNEISGGNAQIGTAVSQANGTITYTAPPVVPTPNNVVQLTITSVDNPAVSITQNISVLNPIPILNTASPMTFNVGPPTTTVTVTGQNFINGAQVLMNGSAVATTFNSGTQLTATLNPTEPGNLDLKVWNPSPGPATSADLIALVNGTPPVPIVAPQDASRFLEH
jgi:IPT/TIG domain